MEGLGISGSNEDLAAEVEKILTKEKILLNKVNNSTAT